MAVVRRPGATPGTEREPLPAAPAPRLDGNGPGPDGDAPAPVVGAADPLATLDGFTELTAERSSVRGRSPSPTPAAPRSARWVGLLVLAGYLVASFAVFHQTWTQPSVRLIGSCCDQPPAVDLLRWTGFALAHGHNPFFTTYLAVPNGVNVIAQPNGMPLLGVLAWPAEAAFGPLVAYNLVVTFGVALSAFAAYVALRRWVGGVLAPVLGGLCYGFSPFVLTHALGHPNVMFAPIPPLFLMVLGDLLLGDRRRPWVAGVLLGLLAAAQFLIGPEILVGLAIASVLVVATLGVVRRADLVRRAAPIARGLGVAVVTGLVVAAWPLAELLAGPQRLSGHFQSLPIGTDLANYLFPGLADQFRPGGGQYAVTWQLALGEAGAFLGPVLIVLCVVTVVRRWRSDLVKVATVVGVVMAVLALGPDVTVAGTHLHVWLPARVLLALPVVQNLIPARLQLFTVLAVAVVVAVFVRRAQELVRATADRRRRAWLVAGTVAVLVAALVPLAPNVRYPAEVYPQPRFFTTDAVDVLPAGTPVLVAPYPQGGSLGASTMVWQALAGFRFRMAGGYVFVPGPDGGGAQFAGDPTLLTEMLAVVEAGQPLPPLGPPQRDVMRSDLRSLGVDAVVLGPTPGRRRAQALLSWVLGRHPQQRDGVALWAGPIP